MAAVYDRMMRRVEGAGLGEWRRELLGSLSGVVLEIGAGTGANLGHYPASVERLVLTEPDRFMRARLQRAVGGGRPHGVAVEVVEASAERLPFPDNGFDAVVGTLVLCSVPDPTAALAEVRRVLRPGGRLVFIEHVAASDRPTLARWQRRVEPVWKRVAGGCHLTRPTEALIAAAGLEPGTVDSARMPKGPALLGPVVRGAARKA